MTSTGSSFVDVAKWIIAYTYPFGCGLRHSTVPDVGAEMTTQLVPLLPRPLRRIRPDVLRDPAPLRPLELHRLVVPGVGLESAEPRAPESAIM